MQKHLLYINLFTITSALALAACADEVDGVVTPDVPEVGEKTPIELTVGGVESVSSTLTRAGSSSAVITTGTNNMSAFDENANIFVVIQSEYGTQDYADPDDPHKLKTTVTRGTVTKGQTAVVFDSNNKRYWDDAHARSSQLAIWAYAQKYKTNWTECKFQKRVNTPATSWGDFEDATYQTKDKSFDWNQGDVYPGIKEWNVSHYDDGKQDGTSILCQDLLFSNNLANNTDYGKTDARLKFDTENHVFPTANEMKFYHALSKIIIRIKEGNGFDKTSVNKDNDFKFTSGNVKLIGFNTKGAFNIKEGEFQHIWSSYDIPNIYNWESPMTGDAYTLEALVIPNTHVFKKTQRDAENNPLSDIKSRFVKDAKNLASDVMMEFIIDGNKYQITSGVLYDALLSKDNATKKDDNGNYIPLEAGKKYVFTFTVGKQEITNISAQVAEWEEVVANPEEASNARIKLLMEERGSTLADNSGFSIFRKTIKNEGTISDSFGDDKYDWTTGFTGTDASATASFVAATTDPAVLAHWSTSWYWPDNLTFYHLRSLGKATVGTSSTSMAAFSGSLTEDATNGDYATITSKLVTSATDTYDDICWGAPFTDDADNNAGESFKFIYDKDNGFAVDRPKGESTVKQLYHAVGPTTDAIKLIMFHMMSEVTFTINTTLSTASDYVDFGTGSDESVTKLELVGFKENGLIRIGSGLVVATGDASTEAAPTLISNKISTGNGKNTCTYGAVPQALDGIKLVITTADKNKYEIDLKDLKASVFNVTLANPYTETTSGSGKYKIDRWYPGFKYNYTFTIKKTGIADIQATIVEWGTVNVDNEDITIK